MLWWFATNTYVRPGSSFSRPLTDTSTPVVARISHDQARAQPCAKCPRRSKKLDVIDAMPSTIV